MPGGSLPLLARQVEFVLFAAPLHQTICCADNPQIYLTATPASILPSVLTWGILSAKA